MFPADAVSLVAGCAFWIAIGLVVLTYCAYPVFVWLVSRVAKARTAAAVPDEWPMVTMIIAAHNEERFIESKLHNCRSLEYPAEKLEIIVASDGSTDNTNEIVDRLQGHGIRLIAYPGRRGKSAALNATVPQANTELIVFSDANTFYDPKALKAMLPHFSDPTVGVVCGKLVLTDPISGTNVDSLYWRYETFLKLCESKLGALLGANGAIYAIRRSLFVPIPDNTIIDDFVIPLMIKIRHRSEIVYEADAVAFEETPSNLRAEFRRRVRIGTGGYQCLSLLWPILNPRYGWTAFCFLFHKILRWSVPFLMCIAFVSNVLLWDVQVYRILLVVQAAFYGLAVAGSLVRGNALVCKLARLPAMFCSMNSALLVGFWKWLSAPQQGTWQRTAR
jgi:cellulose synthase/poly-beta-1,6-N-acetylglucosamine synthase-like glycosyltransferase